MAIAVGMNKGKMTRSEMLRRLAGRLPSLSRAVLAQSAQRYLPQRIYNHWLSQLIAEDLFSLGMRPYRGPCKG
jgi:hypothetical protein